MSYIPGVPDSRGVSLSRKLGVGEEGRLLAASVDRRPVRLTQGSESSHWGPEPRDAATSFGFDN